MPYADLEKRRECYRIANKKYRSTPHGQEKRSEWRKAATFQAKEYDFVGVDGEGGGHDELGRQNYLLLRAGDSYLFEDNRRLTSEECLGFLADLPTDNLYYVAYYFDYDVTMILRDVDPAKIKELLDRRVPTEQSDGHGQADTIYWHGFEIGYFPRKHFKVRRVTDAMIAAKRAASATAAATGSKRKPPKMPPWVTVHDVGTFFQCSFVKALTDWNILLPAERAQMAADKARRHTFEQMTNAELRYNFREVNALAELMTDFREVCIETGYVPRQWEGPGYLASAMMGQHKVTKTKQVISKVPPACWKFANDAYFGGRFEIFKVGHVPNVTEYDICSAYPTSYLSLPCLEHGVWEHGVGRPSGGGLYVADVRYSHREESPVVCNLPTRLQSGSLRWQREGNGHYWSVEIEAAEKAGTVIAEWRDHWRYKTECDCRPFGQWVKDVYAARKALGKSVRGYPLKLSLNSIYGKCCQSIGHPPFANPIWAGLITALTRVRLIEGYTGIDPNRLVMLATDGLYVTGDPLPLSIGAELGDWEVGKPDGLFLIKPGMYAWDHGEKIKTRGVPKVEFEASFPDMRQHFEQEWLAMYRKHAANKTPWPPGVDPWPKHEFPQKLFVSQRLAIARGKSQLAGTWLIRNVDHSFDPKIKRRPSSPHSTEKHVLTLAHLGSPSDVSIPYNRPIGRAPGSPEHRRIMEPLLNGSIPDFEVQINALNFEQLISGLDDTGLFDDDEVDLGEIE